MRKKKLKRMAALALVFVLMAGAAFPAATYANVAATDMGALENDAAGSRTGVADGSENGFVGEEQEPVLYRETDRPDLEPAEVAETEDIIVAAGYGFDVEQSFDGISYDSQAVSVSYYELV